MSGRGRGTPSRSRSGRGRGRHSSKKGNGRRDRNRSNRTKTKEIKYNPHTHGSNNFAPEATVTEIILQKVQKDYRQGNNVVKSTRQGKRLDFSVFEPVLVIAQPPTLPPNADQAAIEMAEETRKHQQEANNLKFQTDYKIHKEREQEYNDTMLQVFSLILTIYCTKAMVHRIEQNPEDKTKIQDDPIALL